MVLHAKRGMGETGPRGRFTRGQEQPCRNIRPGGSYYMFGGTGGEDLDDIWLLRAG